jgi:hypothetical protein
MALPKLSKDYDYLLFFLLTPYRLHGIYKV